MVHSTSLAFILLSGHGETMRCYAMLSDKFVAVFEELLTTYSTIPGTEPSELVRADIVFFETRNGAPLEADNHTC
jgi:hypothetical protein